MNSPYLIIAETRQGLLTQETYEAISFARACSGGILPEFLILGKDVAQQADDLAERSGCPIHLILGDHLDTYNADDFCSAIIEALSGITPRLVCLPHSSRGLDLAPRLAVKLGAACIPAVEKVQGEGFTRSVCSGRYMAEIIPQTDCAVVTVLAGAYPPYSTETSPKGPIDEIRVTQGKARTISLGIHEPVHRDSTLQDAEVIVSAGRGVGSKENIGLIRELASLFPRSAVGASRSVCDLGWLEYTRQIGTTGQTVSPRLYVACGISGAIQHVAGMKGAQTIVAVNTDPDAAIFRVARYCIVEDITKFIPVLVEELKKASFDTTTRIS